MNTDQVPRHPVANDHTSRRSDQVAWKAPAESADTDPGGEPGPTIDEPAIDEPEWYPATRHPPHVKVMRPSAPARCGEAAGSAPRYGDDGAGWVSPIRPWAPARPGAQPDQRPGSSSHTWIPASACAAA